MKQVAGYLIGSIEERLHEAADRKHVKKVRFLYYPTLKCYRAYIWA